jgi:dihydrodipicolinate synthase/N-acetylneuraminate lyase
LLRELGYHAALVSLASLSRAAEDDLLAHLRSIGETLPVIGFYLQPAVGGRLLSYAFWRRACELESLVAVKIAPFNRYQTWDVVRAVLDSDRTDVALYTGNDDNIVPDLLTEFRWNGRRRFIQGGLLGQWAVWTRRAVELLERLRSEREKDRLSRDWLSLGAELTDANAAVFDAANGFAGCIAGVNEVLRRQGLSPSSRCLDPQEGLSSGQLQELDRVIQAYPHLTDDAFVAEHRDRWLQ